MTGVQTCALPISHDIVVRHHPRCQRKEEVGLVCWGIGQEVAVDVRRDLRAQYHVLVLSDDGRHRIYYPGERESYALGRNGVERVGQPVVVGAASEEQAVA